MLDTFAYGRQGRSKDGHAFILGFVAHFAPARMVPALFPASGIASGNLQVPSGIRANPYIRPGRRDDKGFNPGQRVLVAYRLAIGINIAKASTPAPAMEPGLSVRDVTQSCRFRDSTGSVITSFAFFRFGTGLFRLYSLQFGCNARRWQRAEERNFRMAVRIERLFRSHGQLPNCWRNLLFNSFPVEVWASSSTKMNASGTCQRGNRRSRKMRSSAASTA